MLQPSNPKLLVLMALLELVQAKKDRTKRAECHRKAWEYSVLAHALDPGNALALNLLAHHYFFSWKPIVCNRDVYAYSDRCIVVRGASALDVLVAGNQLRLNKDAALTYTITAVQFPINESEPGVVAEMRQMFIEATGSEPPPAAEELVLVELGSQLSARVASGASIAALEVKELVSVETFASQALQCTSLPVVRAESNYLLGKVAHIQRNINLADACYFRALQDAPDMAVAAFGAAQIFFSKKDFGPSLELFERVLAKHPDDKDTQAYVMLLRGMLRNHRVPLEKLKEVAPGFQFEADLWLRQAQLRQGDPSLHSEALKCCLSAKECIEQTIAEVGVAQSKPVPPELMNNISALYHSLGRLDLALEFMKSTLAAHKSNGNGDVAGAGAGAGVAATAFTSASLEGVFFEWSQEPSAFVRRAREDHHFAIASDDSRPQATLVDIVAVGDEVVIGSVKHVVQEVTDESQLICSSAVNVWRSAPESATLPLYVKKSFQNFNDATVSYAFNLARLLEDDGQTAAATEIYIELLKLHPSFIECAWFAAFLPLTAWLILMVFFLLLIALFPSSSPSTMGGDLQATSDLV